MKKLLSIAAIAFFAVACGETTTKSSTEDSLAKVKTADSLAAVKTADSLAALPKDTSKKASDTSKLKSDTSKK